MGGVWPHGQERWHAFAAEIGAGWIPATSRAWESSRAPDFLDWPVEPPLSLEDEEMLF